MKKLFKILATTWYIIELALVAWFVMSWLDVICNNTMPYGELSVWNMFEIIFG